MKNFKQYLMESQRTYKYRIKIVGDVDDKLLQLLELNLQKFSPISFGDPKTTPIQKTLSDFPGVENEKVTSMEVTFKYPVIEPFVKQMARLLGMDENRVRMLQSDYEAGVDAERKKFENQIDDSPVLEKEELADNGKEASKEYAEQYLPRILKDTEKDKIEMKFAGEKTAPAQDFRKISGNVKSPMTTIKRPPLPSTGASKSRG